MRYRLLLLSATLLPTIAMGIDFWLVNSSPGTAISPPSWTGCQNNTPASLEITGVPAYIANMNYCLDDFNSPNWNGMNCNGIGWFKGTHGGYKNPQNCYDACKSCMEASIQALAADAICWNVFGTTGPVNLPNNEGKAPAGKYVGCWMGYMDGP
ncbi:hypothetical protein MMC12_000663 [Toensbergia leucococca]|nr:hypothetical protein [Toensbergia leucococca]